LRHTSNWLLGLGWLSSSSGSLRLDLSCGFGLLLSWFGSRGCGFSCRSWLSCGTRQSVTGYSIDRIGRNVLAGAGGAASALVGSVAAVVSAGFVSVGLGSAGLASSLLSFFLKAALSLALRLSRACRAVEGLVRVASEDAVGL